MGTVLSSCVRCATYVHDRYNNWRWDWDGDDFTGVVVTSSDSRPVHKQRSIHLAIINRNKIEIRRITDENDDAKTELNSAQESGLHLACQLGYFDVVSTLLECGCPANQTTDIGTPIHSVLKSVASGHTTNARGMTAIELLLKDGCPLDARDRQQRTPLFCATELGNPTMLSQFLRLGGDINAVDSNCFSPLYMSTIRGDLACIETLLHCKPDLNLQDTVGRTPLVAALISIANNFRLVDSCLPSGFRSTPLLSRCTPLDDRYTRIAVAETLIRAGADTNVIDNHDRNALTIAFALLEMDTLRQAAQEYQKHTSHMMSVGNDHWNEEKESIYAPLVRLMVLSGAQFPDQWTRDYSNVPGWIQSFYEEVQRAKRENLVQKPAKLVHLCRLAVRSNLSITCRLHDIDKLPVPCQLQRYLRVEYL